MPSAAVRAIGESQGRYRAKALSEEAVAAAWEGLLFGGALKVTSGERVEVVYRGWRSADAGPDFRDAIIALADGRLLRGDVEVHVRSSDWRCHGHGRDRRYDGVVLHVVMWDDEDGQPTVLASGATAPVLALSSFLRVSLEALRERAGQKPPATEPCGEALQRLGQRTVGGILDRAGQRRLAGRAAGFEAAIASRGAEQALYEGLMEALGYAKNREPFRQLAGLLPLASLEGFLQGRAESQAVRRAEALLLGIAGLLPSQRRQASAADYASPDLSSLEEEWQELDGGGWMVEGHWVFFRTRPENYPTRRIGGVARLIVRSLKSGLIAYLLRPLDARTAVAAQRGLVATMRVENDGTPPGSTGPSRSSLIGPGRAKVVAVNVVLPFAVAHGNLSCQSGLADRARWAYSAFPRLPSDAVVRRMSGQLFGAPASTVVDSARRQQALHHIYKDRCRWRRCHECELSGTEIATRQ